MLSTKCDRYECYNHNSFSCYFDNAHKTGMGYDCDYYRREKMPSGMTAEFSVANYAYRAHRKEDSTLEMYISFIVYKKRKTAWKEPDQVTGKDGLKPMIFAKECLKTLEKTVGEYYAFRRYNNIFITVGWENERRHKLYEKMLTREGYKPRYEDQEYTLRKYIRKNGENLYVPQKNVIEYP